MSVFSRDFDDVSVGDRFATRARSITESDVMSFACLTGDHHPQHTDADWAEESPFGGRIAHGMLVLSYAFGLLELDPERIVALRSVSDVVFKQPVRIGDRIRVEGRIDRLRPVNDGLGVARLACRVVNQEGGTACRMRAEALWRRGAPEGAAAPAHAADDADFVPIPL